MPHPAPDEILDMIADVLRRARLAGVTDERAVASMIRREFRSRGVRLVMHEFREGEPW